MPLDARAVLSGNADPLAAIIALRAEFLPRLMTRFNTSDVRRRLGLYAGERIPENERNLTDVRTRIGVIIEYELARLSNDLLREDGINDLFWTYVVANRFPDLEIRDMAGRRGLRFEVKTLQSIAEEKSANFDTLKKDINPQTDFVVVFLWEWLYDGAEVAWDRAPHLIEAFIFHAASLAELRDTYWLNKPPSDLGDGLQGFDLRYAVNCKDGEYHQEEGNYGKLLRIWQDDFPYQPVSNPLIEDAKQAYYVFKDQVVTAGFQCLARYHLPKLTGKREVEALHADDEAESVIGYSVGDTALVLGRFVSPSDINAIMKADGLKRLYVLTDKYQWTKYEMQRNSAVKTGSGKKPKLLA